MFFLAEVFKSTVFLVVQAEYIYIYIRAKVLKALIWRLHVRFPCSYVQNGLYLTLFNISIYLYLYIYSNSKLSFCVTSYTNLFFTKS